MNHFKHLFFSRSSITKLSGIFVLVSLAAVMPILPALFRGEVLTFPDNALLFVAVLSSTLSWMIRIIALLVRDGKPLTS